MNELNQLEKQLHSWTPRHPSAKLKQQLFPRAADAAERPPTRTPVWAWLTPATCLFVLVTSLSAARHSEKNRGMGTGSSNILASISLPYGMRDTRCQEWNVWEAVSFDWTKGGSSLSNTGSFPLLKTNIQRL